jgi:hypothetical protein
MYRYLGGGFVPGVPARNLTNDEAEYYGVYRLIRSGLYVSGPENTPIVPVDDKKKNRKNANKKAEKE